MSNLIPEELKLYIFSYLSTWENVEILIVNYNLYKQFFFNLNKNFDNKVVDSYYKNNFNKCLECDELLEKNYVVNLCYDCNIFFNESNTYLKTCTECIFFSNPTNLNKLFSVYTEKKKIKTKNFKNDNCKICNKKTMHLLV